MEPIAREDIVMAIEFPVPFPSWCYLHPSIRSCLEDKSKDEVALEIGKEGK